MPAKHRDAKFDADTEQLIQSLRALGGRKPAKRAPPSSTAQATKRPARTRARAT